MLPKIDQTSLVIFFLSIGLSSFTCKAILNKNTLRWQPWAWTIGRKLFSVPLNIYFFQINITRSFKHTLEDIVWKLSFFFMSTIWFISTSLWKWNFKAEHKVCPELKFYILGMCFVLDFVCLVGLSWIQPVKMAGGKSECIRTLWGPIQILFMGRAPTEHL